MADWNNVKFVVTETASDTLRRYTEEGRRIVADRTYKDVVPIVQWHQRGRKDADGVFVAEATWSYGSGVGIDSLAKLEANNNPRQIVLRDNDPPLVIWAGPDLEPPGTFVLDWVDGKFAITKRD